MVELKKIKQNKTTEELLEFGIINLDKPSGPTSFKISDSVKKILRLRKTSHFGTLDPKVTGVLPVALNRACKLTGHFIGHDKEYVGIMRFHEKIEKEVVEEVIRNRFIGEIIQKPPVKSRVKREERPRTVYKFEIIEVSEGGKDFVFLAEVQGGTYIRKLIDDLGRELGVGAHMLELKRIRAGIFKEESSVKMYQFEEAVQEYEKGEDKKLRDLITPGEVIYKIYEPLRIKKDNLERIFTGKPLHKEDIEEGKVKEGEIVSAFCEDRFVGIYKITKEEFAFARPLFVMQPLKR
ncbi:RNA-guided pseudouridylation complex pseudouridine synthase subunit Cbf5 [Candidatus Pacearchaeota archaeon ex4484_71]|nr:MAG: RNA-guided pseudouridylation complex pseudouridine synthase subunit Cbf5 [Candidatus Pacearchaeota archaeon ex4484_71]